MTRVALNGFGRVGRLFFRQAFPELDVVAINDLGDLENLAYLLRHDTVYWGYDKAVSVGEENGKKYLIVDGKKVLILQEKDPARLPWKDLGIDIVVECTGLFESFEKSRAHFTAGARRVVISAPAKDAEQADAKTVLLGVNEEQLKTCVMTSNGSCTTNATHPVMAIMKESVGVKKASLTTVHAATALESIVDSVATRSADFRRGRSGLQNIIPWVSGATTSVQRAVSGLDGAFDGLAVRVPIITGSLADITFVAARPTTVEEVNEIFKHAAVDPRWEGVLAVSADPLVSSDIIGMPYGAVIDLTLTKVIDHDLIKVFSWYDNEWGYVSTLLRHVKKVVAIL